LGSVSAIAICCHTNITTIPPKFGSHFDRVADVYHTNSPHVVTTAPMGTSDGDGETRRREDFELRVVHGVRLLDSITAWYPFSRCYCKIYSRLERLTPRSWIRRHEDMPKSKIVRTSSRQRRLIRNASIACVPEKARHILLSPSSDIASHRLSRCVTVREDGAGSAPHGKHRCRLSATFRTRSRLDKYVVLLSAWVVTHASSTLPPKISHIHVP
jgi:hypothetical protein